MTVWTDKSGTKYTLNRIPLGGFVRLKGEDPNDASEFLAPDSFIRANLGRKLIILFAGIAVNALVAWLAFSFAFMHGIKPINIIPDNLISIESQSYLMPTM